MCLCLHVNRVIKVWNHLVKKTLVTEVLWSPIPGIIIKTSGEHACRRSHVKKVLLMKTERAEGRQGRERKSSV